MKKKRNFYSQIFYNDKFKGFESHFAFILPVQKYFGWWDRLINLNSNFVELKS